MKTYRSCVKPMSAGNKSGFTLVELLIVISIIGILVALLMPAVNSARESGRRAQCASNVAQMAKACLLLESKYQFLPGGGWGWQWAGDPDRGCGSLQPGGWHYNILPYIDQQDLHDMGKASSQANREYQGLLRNETPVALFICPTRRKVQVYPRDHPVRFLNISDPNPRIIARSDYAANGGSIEGDPDNGGPNPNYDLNYNWPSVDGSPLNGVIYRASATSMAAIKDGASFTYLLGERYLCPDNYYTTNCDNDQGWDLGYDFDVNRWTDLPPMQDQPGYGGCMTLFGSSHPAGFNMAFCDGSVKKINYNIDPPTHLSLGVRNDGGPTQLQNIDAINSQ